MILVFTRLADLFANKSRAQGLLIYDDTENYSEAFLLWCRKCDGLTPKQFKFGMEQLESRATKAAQRGSEMWPPSYAEFIGIATESWETKAHKPYAAPALPDKAAQGRARKAGAMALNDMKSLFGG